VWSAVLAVAATTLTSSGASAQEWLKDRQNSEGAGIRLGDFEFHPGIAVLGGYDSNWFVRTDKANFSNSGVVGAPEMQITPSISLSSLGAQRLEGDKGESPPYTFRATASGTYHEFFGTLNPEQRNGSVDAAMSLGILPGRSVGGSINVFYDRIIQPSTVGDPDLAYTRDVLGATADLAIQPGGGTLDWHIGGTVTGTLFEDNGGLGYNNIGVSAVTRGRWKFRPKTALIYDGSFGFATYTNLSQGTVTPLHSSDPVRTHIGINGLLTPRLSLLALAGYGGSFFTPAIPGDKTIPQYDSVIAQAELQIYLTAPPEAGPGATSLSQSRLAIGYTRDFQQSYLSDFDGIDRGYAKLYYYFAGRAVVTLEAGGAAIEYPTLFLTAANTSHSPFTDGRIDGTLFGEYRFTNYFGLNTTVKYTTNLSNAVLQIAPGAGTLNEYAMQWQRFEAYLGVRLFL
jgi:hypothetical protein